MADVEGMTHMPPRIILTADDVRELLRQFQGWEMVHNMVDGWESWSWRGSTRIVWIPIIPDIPTEADHQIDLRESVQNAGAAMGIGTDIFVHLGMMRQRKLQTLVRDE